MRGEWVFKRQDTKTGYYEKTDVFLCPKACKPVLEITHEPENEDNMAPVD